MTRTPHWFAHLTAVATWLVFAGCTMAEGHDCKQQCAGGNLADMETWSNTVPLQSYFTEQEKSSSTQHLYFIHLEIFAENLRVSTQRKSIPS